MLALRSGDLVEMMHSSRFKLIVFLLLGFTKCFAAGSGGSAQPFSDETKMALIHACKIDLPKNAKPKSSGGQKELDSKIPTMCACLFEHVQKSDSQAKPEAGTEPFTDGDWKLVAKMLEKGGLTPADMPNDAKRTAIGMAGGFYLMALESKAVQECVKNNGKYAFIADVPSSAAAVDKRYVENPFWGRLSAPTFDLDTSGPPQDWMKIKATPIPGIRTIKFPRGLNMKIGNEWSPSKDNFNGRIFAAKGGAVPFAGTMYAPDSVNSTLQALIPESIDSAGTPPKMKYPFAPYCELHVPYAKQNSGTLLVAQPGKEYGLSLVNGVKFKDKSENMISYLSATIAAEETTYLHCYAPEEKMPNSRAGLDNLRQVFGELAHFAN